MIDQPATMSARAPAHLASPEVVEDPGGHRQPTVSERVMELRLDEAEIEGGRRRGRGRRWLAVSLLAVAGAGVWMGFFRGGRLDYHQLFAMPDAVKVVVASLEPTAGVVLDTSGYVVAPRTIEVRPNVAGTILDLSFDEGDEVRAGEVLARLDVTQYEADLDQAKASLAAAESRLKQIQRGSRQEDILQSRAAMEQAKVNRDLAAKKYQRAQQLRKTIADSEFELAEANYLESESRVNQASAALQLLEHGPTEEEIGQARAEVERARAMAQQAQYFVDCSRIVAPLSGTIIKRNGEVGERALPEGIGQGLFVIADLRVLEVEVDIQEEDLAGVRVQAPCLVTSDVFPDIQYRGRVERFSPVFTRQRGVRQARIRIIDPGRDLLPDMSCRVRVLKELPPNGRMFAIRVPREAVVREVAGASVFVLEGKVARRRPVEIGADVAPEKDGGLTEIRSGLRSGELVLVPRGRTIADGKVVRPVM